MAAEVLHNPELDAKIAIRAQGVFGKVMEQVVFIVATKLSAKL